MAPSSNSHYRSRVMIRASKRRALMQTSGWTAKRAAHTAVKMLIVKQVECANSCGAFLVGRVIAKPYRSVMTDEQIKKSFCCFASIKRLRGVAKISEFHPRSTTRFSQISGPPCQYLRRTARIQVAEALGCIRVVLGWLSFEFERRLTLIEIEIASTISDVSAMRPSVIAGASDFINHFPKMPLGESHKEPRLFQGAKDVG